MEFRTMLSLLMLLTCLVVRPAYASSLDSASQLTPNEIHEAREVANRVKTGRRGYTPNSDGSQLLNSQQVASRAIFKAEGKGFEPSTPCGAPVLQTGR